MAVSGVSGGGSSIYGNRNVLSGLASGMDTESMIENITKATRAKIAQQKQKKTLLGWKQSAYQSVSTPLIEFSKKYMDYQSPTNLLSSAFFDQTIVTSVGKNSNLVSATGKSSSTIEINGVKQLATSAKADIDVKQKFQVPDKLETKEFDIKGELDVSKLAGGTLTFQYGNKDYTIKLSANANLTTKEDVVREITNQLAQTKISSDGTTLAEKIKVEVSGGNLTFKSTDTANNTVKLKDASTTVKDVLELDAGKLKDGISLAGNGFQATVDEAKLKEKQKTTEYLSGKKLSLSLNGETKEIQLLTEEDLKTLQQAPDQNKAYEELLQKKLDDAFGSDKFEVSQGSSKNTISLKIKDPNNIVHIEGGSDGIVGDNSIFGFKLGDGNRLNVNKTLDELGIQFPPDKDTMDLVINGVTIGSYKKDVTLRQIMRDINGNKEAGVKVNYSETSNKFVLTSSGTGTSSKIKIDGGLGEKLFGTVDETGQDAIVDVTVNGEHKQLTRSSNEIDIDGLKVTVSGTFGEYASDGTFTVKPEETVTFTSKPDTGKVFDAIKEMVEEYNKIVDTVYKQMTTKPNRDYKPLTDEQKKEMTKEQIEKWEEKAQEGLLFGDSTLRELHNSLRFIFAPGGEAGAILREIGLQPSDNYKESGKITLDEAKLKAALESDPEKVKNAFNALAPTGSNVADDDAFQGGVMTRLKSVFDKFASTSLSQPGILVQQAGSPKSANSMLNNILQQDIQSIDKVLDRLDIKLKKEIDRYNSKFTKLEKLVAQMNAQSGQLAGFMGGGM